MNHGLMASAQQESETDTPQHESGEGQQIEAQEQAAPPMFEEARDIALALLYSPQMRKANTKLVRNNPEISVPHLAATLVHLADEKLGGQIPDETILPVATEVFSEAVDFAARLGSRIPKRQMDDSLAVMVQELTKMYGTTPEQVHEATQQPEIQQDLQSFSQQAQQGQPTEV